ncbi:SDR family NAD(P)-dependent oxidoreductase [Shouchella clausii]|uniref:SDR family NAD(P)-dependent oxidoreductase n=1 Tax=Shouchella clausii TaxID=79880 RepID=UPI00280B04F9|nr:SDR family NAD(P)-dependent oxidoreductase [Shouchella clausii]WMM32668.1 SDR family NAD(P)-dependent oxidoreductase [Shouchella clausii]
MISTQKIALVTGGSRGLGRNAAIALSHKGIDVIITYHTRKDEADKVVQEIENSGRKAAAIQLDTGNVSSLDAFVSRMSAVLHERWLKNGESEAFASTWLPLERSRPILAEER